MSNQTKKEVCIRMVDGGGDGFRRADVFGTEVKNLVVTKERGIKISDFNSLINFVTEDFEPDKFDGIAYALAGVIRNNDEVTNSPNAHFLDGIRLAFETEEKTKVKSAVFNDMEAAVNGMATLLPEEKYFMGITWSSGIGLRIWKDDKILSVAEGGHMVLDPSPFAPLCGCGKKGHTEAIIGGHAIKRRVIAETEALGIKIPEDKRPCQFLDEEFAKGEIWAKNLYQMIGQGMGIFLANVQTLLHLPLIVWKGTFAFKALKALEPIIRSKMQEVFIDPSWVDEDNLRFQFTPAPDDKDALIGAAQAFRTFYQID